jgi:ADP-ribosylation factor GTPase-activating protein 1
MGALTKGWSLFSSAVVGASRVVSENIIQPGMEKVMDPTFQAEVKGYVSEAGKRAGVAGKTANMWTKHTLGIDVAEGVGGVVGTVKSTIGGGPSRQGYDTLQTDYGGEGSALYQDHEEDDFFDQYAPAGGQSHGPTPTSATGLTSRASATKKSEDWDEWKDF